jgi:hypothetical protein
VKTYSRQRSNSNANVTASKRRQGKTQANDTQEKGSPKESQSGELGAFARLKRRGSDGLLLAWIRLVIRLEARRNHFFGKVILLGRPLGHWGLLRSHGEDCLWVK